ncbi:MAG: T9SS type A sorting domain-containing protein [Panacibacter sp.]
MKTKLHGFIIGLFAICVFNAKAQTTNITYGTWQAFAIALKKSTYPEINGRLFKMSWKDIETAPNVWNWSKFDADLNSRIEGSLPVILEVFTKEDAPDWIFTNGVPKVIEKDSRGVQTGYAPYYKDPEYKTFFKRMIGAVHQHIETLPSATRSKIVAVAGCFGSTGDYISYKGEVSAQYALSISDFYNLFTEFSGYYYDEYKNTSPKIALLSNANNNGQSGTAWVVQNCPGGWLKTGSLGKGYQLNDEVEKASWLYNTLNTPQNGNYVRAQCEVVSNSLTSGWWLKSKYRNMFAVTCYAVYWGLDVFNPTNEYVMDNNIDPALTFFNKYAGQKDASKSTNAMCALKDGLDASDATRFPASTYGTVSRTNQQRYTSIANKFSAFGAKLEDARAATLKEQDNLDAKGTNDVGWNVFTGNYDRYLHQLTPNETSVGYWNIISADLNSMYGRFGRGFDIANNKKSLNFDVDDAFLGNTPLNGKYTVTIDVTYLDDGDASFQLFYDSKTASDKASTKITCTNTDKWKTASFTLTDANFGNKGPGASDFSIRSSNDKKVIFSIVELSRPSNFASGIAAAQSIFSASDASAATNDQIVTSGKGLLISPNPVQTQFFVELKDHSNIKSITVYNQAGQVVLQKNVSGTRIAIQKTEVGSNGVYYIKVFADKATYMSKVIVL